jgi:type IV secretory pathway VirB2 component (pilin)
MVALAILRILTASFAFSGNAESYYRFVRSVLRNWLITGSFAAVAAVVVVPVFWRGSKRQLPMARFLFVLAALVLLVCVFIISEY